MIQLMTSRQFRFLPVLFAFALALLAWGCGTGTSPIASSDDEAAIAAAPSAGVLVFTTDPVGAAAKPGDKDKTKRIGSEKIDKKGGKIKVSDPGKRGGKDDLEAEFEVPKDALEADVEITVTLHGDSLDDLEVEFAPSGLEFKEPAELKIKVGKDKYDKEILKGLSVIHLHGNDADEISFELKNGRDGVEITVEIPGFSRYSMGGGNM